MSTHFFVSGDAIIYGKGKHCWIQSEVQLY